MNTIPKPQTDAMRLTYIFHSGFAVETNSCLLVFDCWLDPESVMDGLLSARKPMYAFASHFHKDHFSPTILTWKNRKSDITYIFSKDILRHGRVAREEADVWLAKGGSWEDSLLKVQATGSNDSGVSWVVETEGWRLFHAGDLGNWYARFLTDTYQGEEVYSEEFQEWVNPGREEKLYLGELKDVAKVSRQFDLAFIPVDGRIGNGYTKGGRQFLERFDVKLFVPMHFTMSGFESAWRMEEFTSAQHVDLWKIAHEGDSLQITRK